MNVIIFILSLVFASVSFAGTCTIDYGKNNGKLFITDDGNAVYLSASGDAKVYKWKFNNSHEIETTAKDGHKFVYGFGFFACDKNFKKDANL